MSQFATSVLLHKTLLDGKYWRFILWGSNTVQSGTHQCSRGNKYGLYLHGIMEVASSCQLLVLPTKQDRYTADVGHTFYYPLTAELRHHHLALLPFVGFRTISQVSPLV
jgi:hypothetical protein